jgi:hypothetical protein
MSAVTHLVQSDEAQLRDIEAWSHDGYNTEGVAFVQFQDELNRNTQLVDVLRATLGIPPL